MAREQTQTGPAYLIVLGGILAGSGLMTALFGFEAGGGGGKDYAELISQVGFNGLPEVTVTPIGWLAIGLFFSGVACMAIGNRVAWRYTDGY